jgi:uncharacterized membrane protein
VGAAAPSPSYPGAPAAGGSEADNVPAALCYVAGLITGIIFLVLAPYNQNKYIRFHAFQSIFMNIACIAISIASSIVLMILHLSFLGMFVSLALFALWIYMLVMTFQGKKIVLPVIGPFAQQQAGN